MIQKIPFLKKVIIPFCLFITLPFLTIAQANFIQQVSAEFNNFQINNYQEKLFVHTDKNFYLAGETIWFKLYEIDGILNSPILLSKVAYVEIINSNNIAVMQASIEINNTTGNGYFDIPTTLQSGIYTFRAYTNWMKNFSANYFFKQQISIVNTLKNKQIATATLPNMYDIQFFAEGGYLVENCVTTLAFKCSNQLGQPIDGSGYIINNNKDTVHKISTLKYGMGSCTFTPVTNQKYTAEIKFKDTIVKIIIKDILPKGYTMHLVQIDSNYLQLHIQSTNQSIETLYLLAHTRGVISTIAEQTMVNGKAIFTVNKKTLGQGITHFTIFNGFKKPLCERLYFTQPNNDLHISMLGLQNNYATKSNVQLQVLSKSNENNEVKSNMSVAIYQTDEFQTDEYVPINAYLYLTSELKGNIVNPSYYFTKNDSTVLQATNNLMLTQGWSRFAWDDVFTNLNTKKYYLPEIEGQILQGKITNIVTNKSASSINLYATIPNKNFTFKQTRSNIEGNFAINMNNIYGTNELIIQTNNQIDSNYAIEIENSFSLKYATAAHSKLNLQKKWAYQLNDRSINMQAENAFLHPSSIDSTSNKIIDTTDFFGIADKKYLLDDYTRFITMEEVIKEFISDVKIKKQNEKFNWRLYNKVSKVFFDNDALILLDGLPIFNTNTLMDFSPLKIKSIDLVTERYLLQEFVNEGIISLKTYDGDIAGYTVNAKAIAITYNGLQKPKAYYSPMYATTNNNNRLVDTRNVLLWMPNVTTPTSNKINFYTSNLKGKFIIVIQAITKDGLAGSYTQFFNVN